MTSGWTLREPAMAEMPLFSISNLTPDRRVRNEARIRALCTTIAMSRGKICGRILGRYKILVSHTDLSIAPHLLFDGYWEMWNTETIVRHVRPGMTVFDVGANVGYFTLLMADRCGPGGRVVAFEPNPATAGLLRATVLLNGHDQTIVEEMALSDHAGQADLVFEPRHPGGASLMAAPRRGFTSVAVAVGTLDDHPAAAEAHLIKIDAEGAEEAIWRGMRRTLEGRRLKVMLIEFSPARLSDPAGLVAEMMSYGFRLSCTDAAGEPVTLAAASAPTQPPRDYTLLLERD